MNQPWIYMCSPSWPPPHLPLHPIPLGLPSAPGPSTYFLFLRVQIRVPGDTGMGVASNPLSLELWTLWRPLQGSRLNEGILGRIWEFHLSLYCASHVEGFIGLSRPNPLWISILHVAAFSSRALSFLSHFKVLSKLPVVSPREGFPRKWVSEK